MRFLMVDRICMLESGIRAHGIKNTTWNDRFLQEQHRGIPVFSSVIAIEAVAQLVSWLIIEHRGFTVKPVITVADSFTVSRQILPGDRMELEGTIESWAPESVLAHGRICINGQEAIAINHAVGFLYPLEELNCPDETRRSFASLYRPAEPGNDTPDSVVRADRMPPPAVRQPVWIDRLLPSEDPGCLRGIKNVTATDPCFNEHFPRKPVLPGVMLIESMVEIGCRLAETRLQAHAGMDIRPILTGLTRIKFRKFVMPGDQLHLEARMKEFASDTCSIAVTAQVDGRAAASTRIRFALLNRDDYMQQFIT